MSKFEAYYGPDMEKLLLRMDLVRDAGGELAWLENLSRQIKPLIEYADGWLEVPREVQDSQHHNCAHWVNVLQSRVTSYVAAINGLKTGSDAKNAQGALQNLAQELRESAKNLRPWEHVVQVYMLKKDLNEVRRYLELMASLNSLVTGFQATLVATRTAFEKGAVDSLDQVKKDSVAASAQLKAKAGEVLQAVDSKLQETSQKFDTTLAEAAKYKEQTREQYEASRDYFQQQGMTAFGSAFNDEANVADKKVNAATRWLIGFIVVLVLVIGAFVAIEVEGLGLSTAQPVEVWRWSMLRISAVAFCAWFIGHFFRERRNFLHVAVANRHRRNLCNAYVAFAEKMTEAERAKYLEEIVPHLAVLGKTGFISKEDIPDMPGGQTLKTCVELLKSK